MNKKLKLFLFAIGIGAASAPTLATTCYHSCIIEYRACMKSGQPAESCQEALISCQDSCGN
ncbi:hypothetical protein [Rugamonas aquatica]|uniref:Uncharacterized protein n=1 Tax=Rugamonas aquatica TaxID=2743357 RepID=A0A6A7MZG7_9BURK|nr:hypothetical protein [Rugamonas aquatica]MQA38048.1 hypothetical protein [Rugamonas aquatica]